MSIGETIELVRKAKNIKIKELCNNKISRQTYFRIINNQVDTSITTFIFLLSQLNISFEEFFFIKNNYNLNRNNIVISKLKVYFEEKNIDSLNKIKTFYEQSDDLSICDYHLYHLILIYIAKLNKKKATQSEQLIKDYLINVDTWTHYELILFNNSMFIFNIELVELLSNKAITNLQRYSALRSYGNESFRMCLNVIICFIDNNEIGKAIHAINNLLTFNLKNDELYEKISLEYFKGIQKILLDDYSGLSICNKVIHTLEDLHAKSTADMFKWYLKKLV